MTTTAIISIDLTEKQIEAIVHALLEECGRIERTGGDWYGSITLDEAKNLAYLLQNKYS